MKNRNNFLCLCASCLGSLLIVLQNVAPSSAQEEEGEAPPRIGGAASAARYLAVSTNWDGAVAVDFFSSFVNRGQVNSDRAVCQPQIELSRYSFYANFWGNLGLTDRETGGRNFSEFDLTLGFRVPIPSAEIRLGLIDYLYPNTTKPETREVFITFEYPNRILTPRVQYFYDFDQVRGSYLFLALEHRFAFLRDKLRFVPGLSSGWGSHSFNNFNFKTDANAFDDGNAYASLQYKLTETLDVGISASYTWLWNPDVRKNAESIYFDNKQFVFGANLQYDL